MIKDQRKGKKEGKRKEGEEGMSREGHREGSSVPDGI